jgi:erythromycin esterase-like protein
MDDIWKDIERSLACAAKAKRLSQRACRLQETSERLRQQSAELIRHNRAVRSERRRQHGLSPKPFLVEKLRLPN